MAFDHTDPDIQEMMVARAQLQGELPEARARAITFDVRRARRADPTYELDLPEGPVTLQAALDQAIAVVAAAVDKAAAAFIEWAEAHREALDRFAWELYLEDMLIDKPTTPCPPDLRPVKNRAARRHHGSASLCPTHGPTQGGTCWKCRRTHQRIKVNGRTC